MSNFLIFKADLHNSTTPAIGTYTGEGATTYFNRNLDLSPDYYLYGNTSRSAIRWFVPTAETTDFEFVADILTTNFNGYFTYFIIADSTGATRLRMWSLNKWVYFANDDSNAQSGTQFIGGRYAEDIGGFEIFHRFRVRVRKLTASSSSVEVYVDGTLKLTATAGAALVTCAKIGFMGGVNDLVPLGTRTGIQNTYVYDLSGGDVIGRGVLSEAFNRFISWMKLKFVPVSGGAVLVGTEFRRTTNNEWLSLHSSADGMGSYLNVESSGSADPGTFNLHARTHPGNDKILRGAYDGTLTWNGQAIQTTSDQRLKQQISEIDDALLDAWEDVELSQFKYNDAVEDKGSKARLHTGYVVQQIDATCKEHGVDISQYGLYCHEEYPEETREVKQADGTKTIEVVRPASEHYSLRYTEAYAIECKYLRRCVKQLTTRIEQLEKGKDTEVSK